MKGKFCRRCNNITIGKSQNICHPITSTDFSFDFCPHITNGSNFVTCTSECKTKQKCVYCHNNAFQKNMCFFHYLNACKEDYGIIKNLYFSINIDDANYTKKKTIQILNKINRESSSTMKYFCFLCNKQFNKVKDAFFHNLECKGTQKIFRNSKMLMNNDYRMYSIKKILALISYLKFPGHENNFSTFFIHHTISYLLGESIMSTINSDIKKTISDVGIAYDKRDFFKNLKQKTQFCNKCQIFYSNKEEHKNNECIYYCNCCHIEYQGKIKFDIHKNKGPQTCKYCMKDFWCNNINIHKKKYCYVSCKFCKKEFKGTILGKQHMLYECREIPCEKCPYKGFDHVCDINGFPLLQQLCIEIKIK